MADTIQPWNAMKPATSAAAITTSDATPLADIPNAIYVGVAGDVAMQGMDDAASVIFKNATAGSIIPFRAQYVKATGTTATNLLALYSRR